MDRREQKTQQAIRNAFLALRAHKPLERITVKELAENAQISKKRRSTCITTISTNCPRRCRRT